MHAGVAVSTGSVEGRAVLVNETLLLVRQVKDQEGEPGAGWGLQAHTVHTHSLLQGCQINLNKIKLKIIYMVNMHMILRSNPVSKACQRGYKESLDYKMRTRQWKGKIAQSFFYDKKKKTAQSE